MVVTNFGDGMTDVDIGKDRSVLIYRRSLLPYSETFILRQAQSLTRWKPVFVGTPLQDGLSLEGFSCRTLKLPDPSKVEESSSFTTWLRRMRILGPSKATPRQRAIMVANRLQRAGVLNGIKETNPSLLHVHFGTNAEEAWPLAIALGIPMVVTFHGYDVTTYPEWWESGKGGRRYHNYPAVLRMMQDFGVRFVAVSDAIRQNAMEYGIRPDAVRKILIGVDSGLRVREPIPVAQRDHCILFVGRFVEKKGIEYLIRAYSDIKRKIPNAKLRIIGSGPLESDLRSLAEEGGISFLGRLSAEHVLAEMERARVLCVPSIRAVSGDAEGLPTVILEAQALGLPVVTSAQGGTTEGIIDGVTGAAFPQRDVRALAEALMRFLDDDGLWTSASLNAVKFSKEKLDISQHSERLEAYYDEIIGVSKCCQVGRC